ncbi:uncharacterized protein LOC141645813 [Silene latifolia]|uniref:uncharacterized protein LOC141645813 n=1 Tax=Silene latifolia TaxID=37657 RepID=UPI003D781FCF
MDNSTPEVDASRPFRSVKEAVSIFGDRLFLKQIPSPPKPPTFEVGNETPQSSPKLPTIEVGNETQSSPDQLLPTIEAGNETHSSPELLPTIQVGTETPESSPELLPTIEAGNETQSSPNLPTIEVRNETQSFDEPSHSSEIILVPTESPTNKMTPIPKNHKKESSGNIVHGNDLVMMMMVLKKLEVELQETKAELKLLKEKGTETELALASLNAELHKSMSKIAKVETDEEVGKATTKSITVYDEGENKETETRNEEKTIRSELMVKSIDSPTLAQILSISDYEGYFKENKSKTKRLMKKKPIVPLVTDLCLWKKKESPNHVVSEPIFSKMYFT